MSIGFGAWSLIVGTLLRQDVRKAEMFEKYRGFTAGQMWTIEYNPQEEKDRENENKKINEMEVDLLSKSSLTV